MALTDKCIAYYKCDTGSWSTLFDSVGNNHLSINGATWTTGKIGNWLSFDWVNNYVGSDDSIVSPIFSLSFWAKGWGWWAILGDSWRPVNCFTGFIVFDDFSIYISTSGEGCWIEKTTLESNYTPTGWYEHIVLTRDGPTWRLYINGSLQNSANLPFNNGNNDRFTIGAAWNSWSGNYERYSNTDIDEVWIWNRALTSTEVSELYNSWDGLQYPFSTTPTTKKWNIFFWFGWGKWEAPAPKPVPVPVAYYTLDEWSWTTAFDSVWSNDWTLSNTDIWTTDWVISNWLDFSSWTNRNVTIPPSTTTAQDFCIQFLVKNSHSSNAEWYWDTRPIWWNDPRFFIAKHDDNTIRVFNQVNHWTLTNINSNSTIPNWTYFLLTIKVESWTWYIYINWSLDKSWTFSNEWFNSSNWIFWLRRNNDWTPNAPTSAKMDEIAFWLWTLPTQSDIEWMWNWWDYRRPPFS